MLHCPWCKKLCDADDFDKHVESHIEVMRASHPEITDACEHLSPKQAEKNLRQRFLTSDEGEEDL